MASFVLAMQSISMRIQICFLAIGETHLNPMISNTMLQRKLKNWKVFFSHLRLDCNDGKKHMGLLVLGSRQSQLLRNCNLENDQAFENNIPSLGTLSIPGFHGLKCCIETHTFAFIYSRCEIKQTMAQELSNKTAEIDYLLGDLNLNTANPIHRKAIDVICGEFKMMLLTELTMKYNSHLDHILGTVKDNVNIFTTAFKNLATDDETTVVRISRPWADFITAKPIKSPIREKLYQVKDIVLTHIIRSTEKKNAKHKEEFLQTCLEPVLITDHMHLEEYVTSTTVQVKQITPFMELLINEILQDYTILPLAEQFNFPLPEET